MSKRNRQQRAAKRAHVQKLVRQPTPVAPLPRVFPVVREPFYLPELLGMTPKCWQGECPPNRGGPVIISVEIVVHLTEEDRKQQPHRQT